MKYLKLALIFIAFITFIVGTIYINDNIFRRGTVGEDTMVSKSPAQVEQEYLRKEWENKGWNRERFNTHLARIKRRSQNGNYGSNADEVKAKLYQLACTEASKEMEEMLSREVVPDGDLRSMDETISILFQDNPGYEKQFKDEFELYYLYKSLWGFIKGEVEPCYSFLNSLSNGEDSIVIEVNQNSITWENYASRIQSLLDEKIKYKGNPLYSEKVRSKYVKDYFDNTSSNVFMDTKLKELKELCYETLAKALVAEFEKREKNEENKELLKSVRNRVAREYGEDVQELNRYWNSYDSNM